MSANNSCSLTKVMESLTTALKQNTHVETGLLDPINKASTPQDHYGQTCTALALLRSGDWNIGNHALLAWLNTPESKIGHLPFNRLALLLIQSLYLDSIPIANRDLITKGIERCHLESDYRSNNWSLLAQTCRLIEASSGDRTIEADKMSTMLKRWTTPKGAFIDFPATPRKKICTPLAYHHKALYLAAIALRFCPHEELEYQTSRLFHWLVHCWDQAGYAGGFGRSNHAIFGDACLISALILLDADQEGPVERIASRLTRQLRDDGFLWLDPYGPLSGTQYWDSYMHLSVYNAWAAAIISSAQTINERLPLIRQAKRLEWNANSPGLHHDEVAGLGSWRDENGNVALFSTTGQPPQLYQPGIADLRYAGGRCYHLGMGDSVPLAPLSCRAPITSLMEEPTSAGAVPLIVQENSLNALDSYQLSSLKSTAAGFTAELRGQSHPIERIEPSSLWQKTVMAIDWRLLGGRFSRKATLARQATPKVDASLKIELMRTSSTIKLIQKLHLQLPAQSHCINPPACSLRQEDACPRLATLLPKSEGRTASHYVLENEYHY